MRKQKKPKCRYFKTPRFKVSGTMQGPQGTPAEKTVASVTFIKNFSHCLRTRLSKDCPHLLEVVDVRKFLTLVNEYFNSEMRQVTETPTVLDRAMNFVEAAKETLKRIAWPGYICFSREKQHYELASQFSIKHEDLLSVSKEPTTFRNKEDIKRLNDWRNEFGRGVRSRQSWPSPLLYVHLGGCKRQHRGTSSHINTGAF